jgi:hypothetical protein
MYRGLHAYAMVSHHQDAAILLGTRVAILDDRRGTSVKEDDSAEYRRHHDR